LQEGVIAILKYKNILLNILPALIMISFFLAAYFDFTENIAEKKRGMALHLLLIESNVDKIITYNINRMRGVATYVSLHAEVNIDELNYFVEQILGTENKIISNIGIFKDTTAVYLYPYEPNKSMKNIDLSTIPSQRDDALRVKDSNIIVITSPVELVQGGKGIMTRLPILLNDGSYWGQLGFMLKFEDLIKGLGLVSDNYKYQIRQFENDDSSSHIVFDSGFDEKDISEEKKVDIPSGYWAISVSYPFDFSLLSITFFFLLLMGIVTYFLAKKFIQALRNKIIELTRSKQRFELAMEAAQDGLYDWNLKTNEIYYSPGWKRMLGYEDNEVPNDLSIWEELTYPGDVNRSRDMQRQLKNGQRDRCELEFKMKNKHGHWVDILSRAKAISDENGKAVRIIGTHVDITERKQVEEELFLARKLESVGQLAAGIAHEINTPAQFIGSNLDFINDSIKDVLHLVNQFREISHLATEQQILENETRTVDTLLEDIDWEYLRHELPTAVSQSQDGIKQISKIVLAMKELSHPGTKDKSNININHLINTALTVTSNEWKYDADVDLDLSQELPLVNCFSGEMSQVFINIIVNAAQAIQERLKGNGKGSINISSGSVDSWVVVKIEDTGGGIPEAAQDHIFDPFFTTKEVGKGTGQGLAIAFDLVVSKHHGKLEFETVEGVGTTFIIKLPLD